MAIDGRRLRSKKLRAVLWYAAGGCCRLCLKPLGPDWQADHIQPWSVTHRTNVHEMQALCADCNSRKGATIPMSLRKHQETFAQLCRDIIGGYRRRPKWVLINAIPGGGKSAIPVIAASLLIPKIADKILWIGPRLALLEQAEEGFSERWIRDAMGVSREIRKSGNDEDPSRGTAGYATTYQAVAENPQLHIDELKRCRYIIVLDENHHLDQDGVTYRAILKLLDHAVLVILMTGTLGRHDGKPIAFVPTRAAKKIVRGRELTGWEYDLTETDDFRVISYGRSLALKEGAIREMEFIQFDGMTEWMEPSGVKVKTDLLSSGSDAGKAVWTAVSTEHGQQMMAQCVQDWRHHRVGFPACKVIVVTASIAKAKDAVKHLKLLGVERVDYATSDDSARALEVIRRFKLLNEKRDAIEVMVTVGMAYEGLDVKDITHVCSLTHVRSRYWLEQMFARGSRISPRLGPPRNQRTWSYVQNDPLMNEVIAQIKSEEAAFHADIKEGSGPGPGPKPDPIAPLWSEVTQRLLRGFDGVNELTESQLRVIEGRMVEFGLHGSPRDVFGFLRSFGIELPALPAEPTTTNPAGPSRREKQLKVQIEAYVRSYEFSHGIPYGTINTKMMLAFSKSRTAMSEGELTQAWTWLLKNYPQTAEVAL